jgi:molybdopterin-guanine dinucleotide biosynthesis protein A
MHPALKHALREGRDKVTNVFSLLSVDPITTRELDLAGICAQAFHNMNTMKDWDMARHQLDAA